MNTFITKIHRFGEEVPIEVEYIVHPPSRGHRDKYGCPEEPDEEGWVKILFCYIVSDDLKTETELTPLEEDLVCSRILDSLKA